MSARGFAPPRATGSPFLEASTGPSSWNSMNLLGLVADDASTLLRDSRERFERRL